MEIVLSYQNIIFCIIICLVKILEISLQSVKTVCMVKGERKVAAMLAFVECVLWGLVVSAVITSLSENLLWLFSYCFGYASGIYIGSFIEGRIALGTSNVQIMVSKKHVDKVEEYLKENNRGFTILDGRGSKEPMCMVIIVLPRKEVKSVMSDVLEMCENQVFVVTSEVSKFTGGYGIRK